MLELSQDVGHRLRKYHLSARGVQLFVRDHDLGGEQYQMRLPYPTQSPLEVAQAGRLLFNNRYRWNCDVRAITIRAINLIDSDQPMQMDIFGDWDARLKQQRLDDCIDQIRGRFGNRSIVAASLLDTLPMLPLPFVLATDAIERLGLARHTALGKDAKAQVTYDYRKKRIDTFLISAQHVEDVDQQDVYHLCRNIMLKVADAYSLNRDFHGVRCHVIFNPFTGYFFADDVYRIVKDGEAAG